MASPAVGACLRCHAKKIRCTGYPACRACTHAAVQCEQYRRSKKSDTIEALRHARQRIQWLEEEIRVNFNIDCKGISTGSSLRSLYRAPPAVEDQVANTPSQQDAWKDGSSHVVDDSSPDGAPDGSSTTANNAPDISLLALNATGEMKYLGPSSGAFFATYAAAVARSLISNQASSDKRLFTIHQGGASSSSGSRNGLIENIQALSTEETQCLLQSYKMWVHPLYPLLDPEFLEALVVRCCNLEATGNVMALGATNYANTTRQSRINHQQGHLQEASCSRLSPPFFYFRAMKYFDRVVQNLRTSVTAIQITLLISIYSSYGPIGSSQWQLAGLAMRMAIEIGLHHAPKPWQASDQESDQKNRVFWTAYAIEISLAYNLGRPPSIGDEHITAKLPKYAEETALGIHHINHRQIQSRIVSQVYCSANKSGHVTQEDGSRIIFNLQNDLNKWRDNLPTFAQSNGASPYPYSYWERLYHGSSFVLHRSSPLCPRPSAPSLEKCIQSAGAYIDCIVEILRGSNVPLTWMLVQGVLFAGLTMLVTARTSFHLLARHSGLSFLLVDLPAWTRKCSICLAIMNERWSEDLLPKLDTQFEALANDTLRMISSSLTAQPAVNRSNQRDNNVASSSQTPRLELSQQVADPLVSDAIDPNAGIASDLDYLETFREYLGIDGIQTFWDVFPNSLETMDVNPLPLDDNSAPNTCFMGRSEDMFQTW